MAAVLQDFVRPSLSNRRRRTNDILGKRCSCCDCSRRLKPQTYPHSFDLTHGRWPIREATSLLPSNESTFLVLVSKSILPTPIWSSFQSTFLTTKDCILLW